MIVTQSSQTPLKSASGWPKRCIVTRGPRNENSTSYCWAPDHQNHFVIVKLLYSYFVINMYGFGRKYIFTYLQANIIYGSFASDWCVVTLEMAGSNTPAFLLSLTTPSYRSSPQFFSWACSYNYTEHRVTKYILTCIPTSQSYLLPGLWMCGSDLDPAAFHTADSDLALKIYIKTT